VTLGLGALGLGEAVALAFFGVPVAALACHQRAVVRALRHPAV